MRLLLAEDEHELSNALVTVLKHNNYSVDAVYDGAILDIMMPKMDSLAEPQDRFHSSCQQRIQDA